MLWWHYVWVPIVIGLSWGLRIWFRRQLPEPQGYQPVLMPPPGAYPPRGGYQQAPGPALAPVVHQQAPTQIKKTPCRNCGAIKMRPPKTACLYCDYCGTLVDWDLKMAMTDGSGHPMRELGRLMQMEAYARNHALATGDHEAYKQSMMRVWHQHMSICPATYSPRIGDPTYRQKLIDYLCLVDSQIGFDPQCQALDQSVARARAALPQQPGPPIHPQALGQLVAAKKASLDRAMTLITPYLHLHPDEASPELARAVMASTFVQHLLPFLDPASQQWLIDEMDLGGDYAPLPQVETTTRRCGSCGGEVVCAPGASRLLCEQCGHFNDVTRPEVACPECQGQVSMPVGTHHFACPYCHADMRLG